MESKIILETLHCLPQQIETDFQAQKKREETAKKAEVARKEQERMENMKRKEVQRITDVSNVARTLWNESH